MPKVFYKDTIGKGKKEQLTRKNQGKKKRVKKESKKALLNSLQLEKLSECLTKKPSDGGVRTGPKVGRWIV